MYIHTYLTYSIYGVSKITSLEELVSVVVLLGIIDSSPTALGNSLVCPSTTQ
jgi:hypothetical protein